jgi:hypothetical protein
MSGAEHLFARGKLGARPMATNYHRATSAPPAPMAAWRSLTGILAVLIISVGAAHAWADSEGIVSRVEGYFKDAPAPAPEEVLSAYLEAQKSGNFEAAYGLLSTADRAFRSKDEYQADEEKGFAIAGALAQAFTYKVKSVKLDGLKSVITVENTHPDVMAIVGPILAMALTGGDDDAKGKVRKAVTERLASGNFPTATTVFTKTLIKEADGWRVYEGLEVKSRATRLLEEGERLARAKKYEAAENSFGQVANIPGDEVKDEREKGRKELAEAKANAEKTKANAEKEQRKQAYLKRLKLYDLETGLYDTYLDKRVRGVKFKLKNEGDLTLSRVEVTVYFKDATGTTIHEESFVPVSVKSFGLDNRGPLRPGYIWELERGTFYTAKSVPTEWKPGAAEARITDLDFLE